MMRWRILYSAICVFLSILPANAQTHDWSFSVLGRGSFTTTSRIYTNPDAPTDALRTLNTPFKSVLSGGLELRAKWRDDDFFFYLSTEYFSESQSSLKLDGSFFPPREVPVTEGYRVFPIELGMQVYVPIGSGPWKLSMGGGIGGYYGERILEIAGVQARAFGNRVAFGIHVGINAEYRILPGISAVASMKFRDPEIDVKNMFDSAGTTYNNNVLTFPSGEIHSRVNIDGMTLGLGIVAEIL